LIESSEVVNSKTFRASVAVLEDHDETVDCICKALRKDGKVVSVANSFQNFEKLVTGKNKFDVFSIDWKINDRNVGTEALDLIKTHENDAARLVFSVYLKQPQVKNQAISGGADFLLPKRLDNYDEYLGEVEKAAKLGLSRQISTRLKELGYQVNKSERPSLEEEISLYNLARSVALEMKIARKADELLSLVKHRGWWGAFDVVSYSNLPNTEKLTTLLELAGVGSAELIPILECSPAQADQLLDQKLVANELEISADELLSVLAYLMRLAQDEPALMPHYWKQSDLFAGSLSSPPWDASGMSDYLKLCGKKGIENALYWIRSH
jgi:CheY-like chemotaxis protein